MARKGRLDRGLMQKKDVNGKLVWYVRLYHHGKERQFGAFPNKTKAREFYEKAKREQKEGRFFPEQYHLSGQALVQEAIDAYFEHTHLKRSIRDLRYFAQWWGQRLRGLRLSGVTRPVLSAIRQELLESGLSPQRVNRYLAWLRACLNLAIVDGRLAVNPIKKLMFKETAGRLRLLTPEEEAKLLQALGPVYAPWARLAILTGLRQEEQFLLPWKDVDLERGMIVLPQTKAGEVQYAYLNEEAQTLLRGLESWQRSKWVFPSQNPASPVDPRHFYARVYLPAMKGTGIEWVTWHDLRHCFASRLAMSGATPSTIAALLRHSTTALVKRYAHLSPTYLKGAVEGVSAFGKDLKPGWNRVEGEVGETPVLPEEPGPVSNGTVTKTGMQERTEEGSRA
ncbi:MAG: site-specific integrase [Nitrospirales bacterium]